MQTQTYPQVALRLAGPFSLFQTAIGKLVRRLRIWREDRQADRAYAALMSMNDHMLRDIGQSRHEILLAHLKARQERRARQ